MDGLFVLVWAYWCVTANTVSAGCILEVGRPQLCYWRIKVVQNTSVCVSNRKATSQCSLVVWMCAPLYHSEQTRPKDPDHRGALDVPRADGASGHRFCSTFVQISASTLRTKYTWWQTSVFAVSEVIADLPAGITVICTVTSEENKCVLIFHPSSGHKKTQKIFELCSTGFSPVTKGPRFKSIFTSFPI